MIKTVKYLAKLHRDPHITNFMIIKVASQLAVVLKNFEARHFFKRSVTINYATIKNK